MIAALQGALRWLFMHAEALFNHAFGDRLNPLYHLGSITFFLFWVVAGSGLYLYAFFDTSVSGAYASVLALSDRQWYLGGLLRSVHRYASDAMAVLMLIHLLRHLGFDRLRGFRAFSWLTGIGLIWLLYVSAINGYMLPWDRLAQFVVVASFEWLDWLPGFGGSLIRNFIYPSSINDRLFSLLSFIHIGAPLLLLLLMWVHVQRVPKAATQPPRAIAIGVLLLLFGLAVLQPVASQGGAADVGSEPARLALDWILLPIYPLLYRWPLAAVWALVVAVTLLLAALPWLGRRRRGGQQLFHLSLHPGARQVLARAGETVLEAGLRAGLALPYECRNGGCGKCVCTVLNGRVEQGAYQPAVLTAAMRAQGQALMCCAVPIADAEIEVAVASLDGGATPVPTAYRGRVERIERLSENVIRLLLSLPAGERIDFRAGQYLNIVLEDGQRRAFSFASAPGASALIELHIRRVPGGRYTGHVFSAMRVGDAVNFEAPLGQFVLHEGVRPILFIAGATGFAPIKSILEDAFRRGIERPLCLYWGVRDPADLYLFDQALQWQHDHANFRVVPIVSEPAAAPDWSGRTGLVHAAILADFPDLSGFEVYVCGSVQMVDTAVPAFLAQGLAADACFSDAFVMGQKSGFRF